MAALLVRIVRRVASAALRAYYWLKVQAYKPLVGREAAAYVLHEAIRPDIVLRMYGAKVGRNVRVNIGLVLHETSNDFSNLTIGDDVHIGKFVLIDLSGKVTIGNRVGLGMFTKILTHQNLGDSVLSRQYPPDRGDLEIPDDAVISSGTFVLYPTRLEPGTLVSANSVVRGDYPGVKFLVGNPARASLSVPKQA